MTFTSFNFLVFFPLVVLLYNLIPQKGKVVFLLVVSYFFYLNMQPVYAILLLGVTLCTYFFARWISVVLTEKKKHRLLVLGVIVVISPLFFYKYFGFINDSVTSLLESTGIAISLPRITYMLPVGISFYTFMAIGYLVDVYNEDIEFEKNILSTGLFLSFFPIILSGPIERAGNLFPQFKYLRSSTYDDLVVGLKLMLWGYFMKLCVADRLGLYVDAVFDNLSHHNGTTLAFASVLYPFQVYADLGGYSLIAIGVARCLGIKVIENFHRPFFATSMSEFWRRWHISLIKWLTDYIYTPLSFSLRSWRMWGIFTALMLTFLISGIWHGAALTFIVWGFIQGVYLCIDAAMNKKRTRLENKYNLKNKWWWILVCCVLVFVLFAFSQIFGRCGRVEEAIEVIKKIFGERGKLFVDTMSVVLGGIFLFILFVKDFADEFGRRFQLLSLKWKVIRYFYISFLIAAIVLFGVLDGGQFIYFQF